MAGESFQGVPAEPNNPLDKNNDGIIDSKDIKILIQETFRRALPIVMSWIMYILTKKVK